MNSGKKMILWMVFLVVTIVLTSVSVRKSAGGEAASQSADKGKKIPVILDTDICDDIDDTWAVALLLQSPEFDVKLITTAVGDTTAKTKVVARILQMAGRTDIPIGTGVVGNLKKGHRQDEWVKDFDLSKYPGKIYPDGVQAMIDTIMKSPEQITLIAVGPLPNVAAALEREPNIAKKVKFVGMHGSVRRGYGGSAKPQPEYNIAEFLKESQKVFTADWIDMTITPLDTCSLVILKGDKYKKVLDSDSPAAKIVIDNYRVWLKSSKKMNEADINSRSSTLFDTVAVYLAMKTDLLEMENLGITVTHDGKTAIDEKARKVNCATKWKDLNAFEGFLAERLTNPMSTMEQSKPVVAAATEIEQTMCPVMGGAIDKTVFVEYKGKKVYFCCAACKSVFNKDPEKYTAKLPQFAK